MAIADRVGLLISQDLLFISKVTGIASSLGFQVETAGMPQGLIKAAVGGYACIFFDLSLNDVAVGVITNNLRDQPPPPVIAFGPHVEVARFKEARDAGCREVLPRSQFNMHLPEILTRYLGSPDTTPNAPGQSAAKP